MRFQDEVPGGLNASRGRELARERWGALERLEIPLGVADHSVAELRELLAGARVPVLVRSEVNNFE